MPETADLKTLLQQPLLELLEGKGAHANPLGCTEDLSAALARRRPEGHPCSVWEVVLHLNYWMEYDLKRVRGAPHPYPSHAADSWPPLPPESAKESWQQAVAQFAALLRDWQALCRVELESLMRPAVATRPAHSEQASSVLALVIQTIAHNSYHVGQIVLVRRALGAWPSKRGGDTW